MKVFHIIFVVLALAMALVASAQVPTSYSASLITGLHSPDTGTNGISISNAGQVLGWSFASSGTGDPYLFSWASGTTTSLSSISFDSYGTSGPGLYANSGGHIAGTWSYSSSGSYPFFYNGSTFNTDILGTLGSVFGNVAGLDDSDTIYGNKVSSGTNRPYKWSGGTVTFLDSGYGLNSNDQILYASTVGTLVGQNNTAGDIFYFTNGVRHTLSSSFSPGGVNSLGEVCGSEPSGGYYQACLIRPNVPNGTSYRYRVLGLLAGGTQSAALSVNAFGEVTGWSTCTGGIPHAFVFIDGQMVDLNTLVSGLGTGVTLCYANSINDEGQIVAVAYTFSGGSSTGPTSYVLTPNY